MNFDLNRMKRSDQVIAVCGAILFICQFLPFFHLRVNGTSVHTFAGHSSGFLAWGGIWIGFLAGGLGFFPALGVAWPAQSPVTRALATLGVSGLATLLLVIRLLDKPGGGGYSLLGTTVSLAREAGLYIAVIAVIVQVVFAVIAFRESGESLPTKADFQNLGSSSSSGATGSTPPAAPTYQAPTYQAPTYQAPTFESPAAPADPPASWQNPQPPTAG